MFNMRLINIDGDNVNLFIVFETNRDFCHVKKNK